MTEPRRSYLFVTFEGGGNVAPVLGVVRRMTARGHRVRVLTEPCLAAAVEAAGAEPVPFRRYFIREDRAADIFGDWEPRTPIGALQRTFERVVFGPAPIVAEETHREMRREPPDVVVADVLMPGALIAAEAAGVPRVVLFHMPEYLPGPGRPAAGPGFLPRSDLLGRIRDGLMTRLFLRQLKPHLRTYNAGRTALGLQPLSSVRALVEEYHRADLRLIQTSRDFDFPIDPPPANVTAVATAPHARLFPGAAAVVTHAGHGTVMRALAAGVPVLCLPMGRDQDDNAARVVAHGVGLRLRPSVGAVRIAGAVRRLVDDPGYGARARRLGGIILEDAAAGLAVRELEAVGRVGCSVGG
jgi:UDP:flavonoid glycosyltransferase YjiC (YdhE family)